MNPVHPPLRCCVLGAGRWGRILIEGVDAQLQLSGIACAGSSDSLSWIGDRFPDVPHGTDAGALLRSGGHDAVVIATPSATHAEFTHLALELGMHVLVEKPICFSRAEAETLRRFAVSNDRELFVGYVYLHQPAFEALRAAIAGGPPASIAFDWNRPHLAGPLHWELLPHELAVLSVLWDEPPAGIEVRRRTDDALECEVHASSGRCASVRLTRDCTRPKSRRVRVEIGQRTLLWCDNSLAVWRQGWRVVPLAPAPSPVERELARFAANIRSPADRMARQPALVTEVTGVIEQTFS